MLRRMAAVLLVIGGLALPGASPAHAYGITPWTPDDGPHGWKIDARLGEAIPLRAGSCTGVFRVYPAEFLGTWGIASFTPDRGAACGRSGAGVLVHARNLRDGEIYGLDEFVTGSRSGAVSAWAGPFGRSVGGTTPYDVTSIDYAEGSICPAGETAGGTWWGNPACFNFWLDVSNPNVG